MKKIKQKSHKNIVIGIFFAITISFFSYSYAIASTTFSVSDMESKNAKITNLQTEIAGLELDYFTLMNNVSTSDVDIYGMEILNNVGYASLEKDTKVAYNY